jgi:cytochrome bd-type quinol oxidase subunit 1
MHFPWWYVPDLTAPMLIAVISVVHVLVSHYAVGGGLFLAIETRHAYRQNDRDYLAYLKKHTRFFVLLTVVFGAITGVGIWWTIGLASPLATSVLIRTFVFGWAIEWVFFVLELTAAFIFYYYWGRLPQKTHVVIGIIYALAAWISLVLITGITAFMLNPGGWGENRDFWVGFFNPQFIPQTVSRTGGALLLSSLYVYLHAAVVIKDKRLQQMIEKRSTGPALLGAVLITAGGAGWYLFLPPSAQAALYSASALNVLVALIFAATAAVFTMLYLGPYRNPGWLHSPGFAACLLLFGLVAFSTGEFIREAVRKPYVLYNVVFSHQVMVDEVPEIQRKGFLESGVWTKAFVQKNYPEVMEDGRINARLLPALDRRKQVALGEVIFQYHCNDCHAASRGYAPVGPMIQGWKRPMIRTLIDELHEKRFVMPPWCGTPEEADVLTTYLESIAPPAPKGMLPASVPNPHRQPEAK